MLLRLVDILFLCTIELNITLQTKADAINQLLDELHLGAKKVQVKKALESTKKEAEPLNFIGREAAVLLFSVYMRPSLRLQSMTQ
jgi:hypothetical protein